MPTTDGRPGQLQPLAGVDTFEAIERQVILPTLHDGVGEHAGPGKATLDGQLQRLTDNDLGAVARRQLAHELRPHSTDDDHRTGPPLDDFADLLSDALEGVEALLLHLERDDLYLDARQVLG